MFSVRYELHVSVKGKKEVKFSLSTGIAALILNIGTGGGGVEWLTSRPGRFTSWKETPYTLNSRVGGWVGGCRISVDVFPSRNSNPKYIKFSLQTVKIILY